MKRIILIIGIISSITNLSLAADQKIDKKQVYELRKECGKTALEYSQRWKLCDGVGDYQSHYNMKLNVCFIHMTASCNGEYGDSDKFWSESVVDVNENKKYADYIGGAKLVGDKASLCYVDHNKCKSLAEFWELIKPYMNE